MFMSTFYYFLLTVLSESEIFISSVLAFSLESTKYNDNVGSTFYFSFKCVLLQMHSLRYTITSILTT